VPASLSGTGEACIGDFFNFYFKDVGALWKVSIACHLCHEADYIEREKMWGHKHFKGLNLAAVMFTTVQMSRLPLWRELLVSSRA
jgi:hypothetical protein